jgi:hypothetical protein
MEAFVDVNIGVHESLEVESVSPPAVELQSEPVGAWVVSSSVPVSKEALLLVFAVNEAKVPAPTVVPMVPRIMKVIRSFLSGETWATDAEWARREARGLAPRRP